MIDFHFRILEPVLCVRRILLNETKELIKINNSNVDVTKHTERFIKSYIAKSLLKSTDLARNADMYQQTQLFILHAETYLPRNLFIEKAKLLWKKGDHANSLKILDRGITELEAVVIQDEQSIRKIMAEAKFLIATYNAQSMNSNNSKNIQYFQKAIQALPESEKCLVCYAEYLEKIYAALSTAEQTQERGNNIQKDIMTTYGKSMLYGSQFIHQSMPRLLSIWLDFTAKLDKQDHYKKTSQSMNLVVERFSEILPKFMFFTAFSQLVSRICHPSTEVYAVLKTIIIKLIIDFPQQTLWMILSVYKSSYSNRVKRCTEIFSDSRLSAKEIQKLITDFNQLAERMIELTNHDVKKDAQVSVSHICRQLPRTLNNKEFSQIIIPTEKYMLPVLPAVDDRQKPANSFNAFPNQVVYIKGIREELVIMPSLQRPKRITLIGSDGKDYMFMMKPKDDLRKDFRLMEFNAIVNQYLHQDPEARERRLHIRTYAVIPLNEECGILEWVSNLQPLRPIISGK